jgi:MFS family permease
VQQTFYPQDKEMLPSPAIPATAAPRVRLARAHAFWFLTITLGLLLFASSAPSPLYIVYQQRWGFSEITLTSVFAIYALALLVALLVAGAVSDHAGRRPTLLFALVLEIAGMLLFAEARSVVWLLVARATQGVATGIAMGSISAALLDLQPERSPRLGALLGAAAPLAGLSLGALGSGLLVQFGPDPMRLVFWLLLAGFVVATLVAAIIPEPVPRRSRAWRRTLKPSLAVPGSLRVAFVATIPCLSATWALGGLILSLGPSLTASVLGKTSHVTGGLPIFIMAGISSVASIRLREVHARTAARGGLTALILGVALTLLALDRHSLALFLIGAAVAGLALSNRAPADQRAGLVSSIFAVSYLAFSLPAVAAGAAATSLGLLDTAYIYGAALIVLAAIALALSHQLEDPQSGPPRGVSAATAG